MKPELFQASMRIRDELGYAKSYGEPEWFVRLTLPDGSTHIARVSQLLSVPSAPEEYLQECNTENWWKEHALTLDENWAAHHDSCMSAIREAIGMPEAAVGELVNEINRLRQLSSTSDKSPR